MGLNIRQEEVFDSLQFWKRHDVDIVLADSHTGAHSFYPLYRCRNAYSYSPFRLLQYKGRFVPDENALAELARPGNEYSFPDQFIDVEIERVGGPPRLTAGTSDVAGYAAEMARTMQADIDEIEALNPDYTNYVLCGGRDSLNLLLTNWRNKVVVLSARPNFELVQDFVTQNKLGFEVVELQDPPPADGLDREIAEACTLVNLEHWRWTTHLVQLATESDHKAIFWKGQLADTFLTDFWRSYTYRRNPASRFGKKVWRRVARALPDALTYLPDQFFLEDYRQSLWKRGAVWQGAHLGFLRSMTGCLCLSAYHGPRTSKTWLDADLRAVAKHDLRPEIGRSLFGGEVWYPSTNPGPPASVFRENQRSPERFIQALKTFDISTDAAKGL